MRILILCSGNSCRSQMAEAFVRSLRPDWEVFSAGTEPAPVVHPKALKVMSELGMDISTRDPKSVDLFIHEAFDYVVTVCDDARESCPAFTGRVGRHLHFGFEDPARALGTRDEIIRVFRKVRDEIAEKFGGFVEEITKE